jgi:hypothetical protein
LFAQAKWDDDLPLRGKPYGFELLSCTHMLEYDIVYKVLLYTRSRIICLEEEYRRSGQPLCEKGSLSYRWDGATSRKAREVAHPSMV